MNVEQPSHQSAPPLLKGSEEQVVKLRKRLEDVYRNVSLTHDVVAICIELTEGNSGDFNPEMAHVLRRCAADRLYFQLEVLTKVIERLWGHHDFERCRSRDRWEDHRMSTLNYQRSRQVLQALVQGVDPETSAELPKDTVLNRVDIVRALLAAIDALDTVNARALRRAQLPRERGQDVERRGGTAARPPETPGANPRCRRRP